MNLKPLYVSFLIICIVAFLAFGWNAIFIILGLILAIYLTSTLTRLYLRKKFNNFLNEINKMNSDLSKEDIFGQSENELLTENFERLFNPELGSGIKNLLFEQMTPITEQRLQDEVASAINAWEQRAEILSINVISEDDFNRYRVQVRFRVINTLEEEQVDVFLARER